MMMPEERRDHPHWRLVRRVFGFHDCRDAGAAKAAAVLGVPKDELRMHVDVNLTGANRHALTIKLLAHADAEVAAAEQALADARALRHDVWVAEQVAERDTLKVDEVTFRSPTTGQKVTYPLLPHELMLKSLLEEEYV